MRRIVSFTLICLVSFAFHQLVISVCTFYVSELCVLASTPIVLFSISRRHFGVKVGHLSSAGNYCSRIVVPLTKTHLVLSICGVCVLTESVVMVTGQWSSQRKVAPLMSYSKTDPMWFAGLLCSIWNEAASRSHHLHSLVSFLYLSFDCVQLTVEGLNN